MTTQAEPLTDGPRPQSMDRLGDLVARHVDLVYATARRLVGDGPLAEDVTQATFLLLLRKADRIDPRTLPGWLVNAARLTSREAVRSRRRRWTHEARAARPAGASYGPPGAPIAEQVRPLLDAALSRLGDADRTAVVLRSCRARVSRRWPPRPARPRRRAASGSAGRSSGSGTCC